MFPYSLNSSQPLGNKWRRQKYLEAEFNQQSMAAILDLCIPIFVFTDPRWRRLPGFPENVLHLIAA